MPLAFLPEEETAILQRYKRPSLNERTWLQAMKVRLSATKETAWERRQGVLYNGRGWPKRPQTEDGGDSKLGLLLSVAVRHWGGGPWAWPLLRALEWNTRGFFCAKEVDQGNVARKAELILEVNKDKLSGRIYSLAGCGRGRVCCVVMPQGDKVK